MATAQAEPVVFEVRGPIARGDLPGLCERVCAVLARTSSTPLACDVASVEADLVTVDALAHLGLAARRHGRTIQLLHASAQLRELVRFLGLEDVLPVG